MSPAEMWRLFASCFTFLIKKTLKFDMMKCSETVAQVEESQSNSIKYKKLLSSGSFYLLLN